MSNTFLERKLTKNLRKKGLRGTGVTGVWTLDIGQWLQKSWGKNGGLWIELKRHFDNQ